MDTFLDLEESSGKRILINMEQIVSVVPETPDICRMALTNQDAVMVKASLDRLAERTGASKLGDRDDVTQPDGTRAKIPY